ncbi:hypothetical protein [Proteus sp. G2671]|nr:hypothetical protein [Proteus sp. G2671]NBM02466.1 hypothetical protein [Proteus sp. G2671]
MLELMRSYFNHPRLVVVISGDLELYSHIVLKKKYEELIITGYNNSSSKTNKFEDFCHNMEQQYLAKIFPIENRIELKQFNEVVKDNLIKIKKLNVNYEDYINDRLSVVFNLESRNLKSYISYIEEQPLRTIIQLLVSINSYENDNLLINKMPHIIKNCFLGVLSRSDLDLNGLLNSEVHINKIGYESFNILNKNEEMETGFYFRPTGNNNDFNASMLLLNSISQIYLKSINPAFSLGRALSFMLTNGASSNIYMAYVSDLIKDKYSYLDYLNYIGLNKKDNILSFVSHYSPLLFDKSYSNTTRLHISSGVIRIPRSIRGEKYKDDLIDSLNKFYASKKNDVKDSDLLKLEKFASKINNLKLEDFYEFIASFSILSSSHSLVTKNEGRDYCSFYCLLGAVADLLLNNDDKIYEKLVSIQNFSAPSFLNTEAQSDDNERDEYITDTVVDVDNNCFYLLMAILKKWKKEHVNNINSSPLMLGKIWVRVFYTINNISFSIRNKILKDKANIYVTLDYAFKLFCYGFINSILIEEVRYKNINKSKEEVKEAILDIRAKLIKATNVNMSSQAFYKNYFSVVNYCTENKININDIVPFTMSMKKCPLLSVFLNDNNDYQDDITNLISSLNENEEEKLFSNMTLDENDKKLDILISKLNIDKNHLYNLSFVPILRTLNPKNTRKSAESSASLKSEDKK